MKLEYTEETEIGGGERPNEGVHQVQVGEISIAQKEDSLVKGIVVPMEVMKSKDGTTDSVGLSHFERFYLIGKYGKVSSQV